MESRRENSRRESTGVSGKKIHYIHGETCTCDGGGDPSRKRRKRCVRIYIYIRTKRESTYLPSDWKTHLLYDLAKRNPGISHQETYTTAAQLYIAAVVLLSLSRYTRKFARLEKIAPRDIKRSSPGFDFFLLSLTPDARAHESFPALPLFYEGRAHYFPLFSWSIESWNKKMI